MSLSVRTKLLGSFLAVSGLGALLGIFGILQMGTIHDHAAYAGKNSLPSVSGIATLVSEVKDYRQAELLHVISNDAKEMADLTSELTTLETKVSAGLADYEKLVSDDTDRADWQGEKTLWQQYLTQTRDVLPLSTAGKSDEAMAIVNGDALKTYDSFARNADTWLAYNETLANGALDAASSAYDTGRMMVLAAIVAAILLSLGLGFFLARSISIGLLAVQAVLTSMADNCATFLENGLAAFARHDMTVEVHPVSTPIEKYGSDEIGMTAHVTNKMLRQLQATIESYETARAGLTDIVTEVREAAGSVAQSAEEVSAAATQSGRAAEQIAQTIGQVAKGAEDQAKAAADTSSGVQDLTEVIDQVGGGASQTARKVEGASQALEEMAGAIQTASAASGEVRDVAAGAALAAQKGADAVKKTVAGMGRIRGTVVAASAKVAELGAKSDQIGAIVETIDDIAEQTNLLALNAAIEAARAGEQGKGFAVVADEVRKLAERASRATKEIGGLIAEVQTGTEEAVRAMAAGTVEVETGAELADQAGNSLDEIAQSVAATKAAVIRITTAVDAMSSASAGVITASDEIATIAAQTNEAAGRMTRAAHMVTSSVDSIAAISQENSAASEEVSAATEEMSGQAEEVVASASSLADLAAHLDRLVARFRLDTRQVTLGTSATPEPARPTAIDARRPNGGKKARAA